MSQNVAMSEPGTGVKVAKGFLYVVSRVVAVVIVVAVLGIAYRTAVNTMTVNMVIEDAFAKRAQFVLTPAQDGSDLAALRKLFTSQAMDDDTVLQSNQYKTPDYTITGYYARTEIADHIVWSWENEATVKVTDIVRDIRASSNLEPDSTGRLPEISVPEWQSGIYTVKVVKEAQSEGWMIDGIEFEEAIFFDEAPAETPAPAPETPSEVPTPSVPIPTVIVDDVSPEG